jgi:hypothetical protein
MQRIRTMRRIDDSIEDAGRNLRQIRGLTDWHRLSPGARKALERVRNQLNATVKEIEAMLDEEEVSC